MQPAHALVNEKGAYCLQKASEVYAVYLPNEDPNTTLNLTEANGVFEILWFNPLKGGKLKEGSIKTVLGGGIRKLGTPPKRESDLSNPDWVVLVRLKK